MSKHEDTTTTLPSSRQASTLFDITRDILEIGERLANPEDDNDFEDALRSLDALDIDLAAKSENIVKFLRHLDAQVEAAKAEEKRMKAWRGQRERAIDRLRENLAGAMNVTGTKKIAWTGGSVTLVEPKKAKLVCDVALLPDEYVE